MESLQKMDLPSLLAIIAIVLFISIAFATILFRAIFKVKRQLWNQQQIIKLLLLLAEEKNGVTDQTSHIREENEKE